MKREYQRRRTAWTLINTLAASLVLCSCATAKDSRRQTVAAPAAPPIPVQVYVLDFDLDAAQIQSESSVLPPPPKLPGLLGKALPTPGRPKDPQALARELVDSMSVSLVEDLKKAGLKARRLAAREAVPTNGWLIRGVFTTVDEGHRLRRAVVGFGAGKTRLQVLADFQDLSQGELKPFYNLAASAESGQAPGAGPMIVLAPAGAAARFVLAGQDLNRNVNETASQIARTLVRRQQEIPPSARAGD